MCVHDDPLTAYPVIVRQSIEWGDMDAHGHVNNIVYYRYMENARIAYYERIGKYEFERVSGVSFVLASNACRYRASLTYPGTILVGARVTSIEPDRAQMRYRIVTEAQRVLAAEGEATLVAIDLATQRKAAFPQALRERILELQGTL